MKTIFSLFIILFFTQIGYSQVKVKDQIVVPFKLSSNGHIIIKAKVNGVEGNFVFDTGAGLNLLTKNFADKIENLESTNNFYTGHRATGEALEVDLWKSETLRIGEFQIKNPTFAVYDIDFPFAGLISLTPFRENPITIDFTNKVLTIESEKSLQELKNADVTEIPLQLSSDRGITLDIFTYILLDDDLKLQVGLDSGAGFDAYRFNSRYMDNLDIDSTNVESTFRKSAFKPEEGNYYYKANVAKMTTENGNIEVEDFKTTFVDGLIYEGIMGINWLGDQITIDIPEKKLFVK